MDTRPVGVFDSGLGGISVLGQLLHTLPNENYIYYGDTVHIPYGDKPPEEVLAYTHQGVDTLISLGCKAIVVACNTATSAAAGELRQELQMPVIGMEPALKPAALLPGEGKVVVLATRFTLSQPKFARLMALYGKDALPIPCPGLMECVEAGELDGPRVQALLGELLAPCRGLPTKAVVLGCTHYPFLRKAIASFFAPGTPLIDGNLGTARQLGRRLEAEGLSSPGPGGGVTFLSSAEGEDAALRMQQMLELWRRAAQNA